MSILTAQQTITQTQRDLAVIDLDGYARQNVRDQLHAALLRAHPIVIDAYSGSDLGGDLIVRGRAAIMDDEFIDDLSALVAYALDPWAEHARIPGATTRMRLILNLLRSAQDREP